MKDFIQILADMLEYIVKEVPGRFMYHVFMVVAMVIIAYVAEFILVATPVLIWEAITKKKVPSETKEKVSIRITIVFTVILVLMLLYRQVT